MADHTVYASNYADSILKEVFPESDPFWDWLDQETPALDLIESTGEIPFHGKPEGRGFIFPYRKGGSANPMVGYPEDQDDTGLPSAGKQSLGRLTYLAATHFQALQMSGTAFDKVKGGAESTADSLTLEMQGQAADARQEHNRLMHGDGGGALAQVTVVNDAEGRITVDDISRIQADTEFVIRDGNAGTLFDASEGGTALTQAEMPMICTSVDTTNNYVYFTDKDGNALDLTSEAGDDTLDTAKDWYVYRYDQQGKVINGFGIIVSDSNPTTWGDETTYFGGVSADTETLWRGYRHDAGGDGLSLEEDIQPFIDNMKKRAGPWLKPDGNGARWYALCGRQAFRLLENVLRLNEARTPMQVELRKGEVSHMGINYEGMVFVVDDDAPANAIRCIAPNDVRRWVIVPWKWDDREGSIWKRTRALDSRDADAFKAYMYTRQQMICVRRLTQGEIYNLVYTY